MKRRPIFLCLALLGAALWTVQLPTHSDVGPLPGQDLKVRLEFEVRFAGDYLVEATMPVAKTSISMSGPEFIDCDISVVVANSSTEVYSQHVTTINSASERGWAYTQQFVVGPAFHLNHGTYDATISGGSGCPAAVARGASITVVRAYKEHIVSGLILIFITWTALVVGVLGLILPELGDLMARKGNRTR